MPPGAQEAEDHSIDTGHVSLGRPDRDSDGGGTKVGARGRVRRRGRPPEAEKLMAVVKGTRPERAA